MKIACWKSLSLISVVVLGMALGSGPTVAQQKVFESSDVGEEVVVGALVKHSGAIVRAGCVKKQGVNSKTSDCLTDDSQEINLDGAGATLRKKNGLFEVSPAQQKTIAKSIGFRDDPRCYSFRLTNSSRNWMVMETSKFSVTNQNICEPFDGSFIYHKVDGTWEDVAGGSTMGCSQFKAGGEVAKAGGSRAVINDLRKAWNGCDPSY